MGEQRVCCGFCFVIQKLSLYNINSIKENRVSQLLFTYQTIDKVYGRHSKYTIELEPRCQYDISSCLYQFEKENVCISLKKKLSESAINCEDKRNNIFNL